MVSLVQETIQEKKFGCFIRPSWWRSFEWISPCGEKTCSTPADDATYVNSCM